MRNIILSGFTAALLLTGCARHYAITLSNGTRVTTDGKPKLVGNSYVFKDATGRPVSVPAGRVREISPASDTESFFTPPNNK